MDSPPQTTNQADCISEAIRELKRQNPGLDCYVFHPDDIYRTLLPNSPSEKLPIRKAACEAVLKNNPKFVPRRKGTSGDVLYGLAEDLQAFGDVDEFESEDEHEDRGQNDFVFVNNNDARRNVHQVTPDNENTVEHAPTNQEVQRGRSPSPEGGHAHEQDSTVAAYAMMELQQDTAITPRRYKTVMQAVINIFDKEHEQALQVRTEQVRTEAQREEAQLRRQWNEERDRHDRESASLKRRIDDLQGECDRLRVDNEQLKRDNEGKQQRIDRFVKARSALAQI